jgi:hypothetical protein
VERVRTALRDHIDYTAHRSAVLRLEAARLDLQLLDEFERDFPRIVQSSILDVREIHAVYDVHVFGAAGAVHLISTAFAFIAGARRECDQRIEATILW